LHKSPRFLERLSYAVIGLAALVELLGPFMVRTLGYDGFHALMWIDGFPDVLSDGVWYPHWLPDGYGRLGSLTFYFYPPLAYFIIAPFRLLLASGDAISIYHLFGILATLASLITMHYLLRVLHSSSKLAWLGALMYAFSPYHLNVLYIRSGPAEHLAFVWAPLVFAGLFKLLNNSKSSSGFWLLGFSWGLLLLSHVPAAATVGLAGLVVIIVNLRNEYWGKVSLVVLAVLLGSGLAAFYLLPVEHFRSLAQLQYLQVTHEGLEDQLLSVLDLLHGHDFSVSGIGFVQYLVVIVITIALLREWRLHGKKNDLFQQLLWVGIAIIFFQTVLISRPVWNILHLTQIIQFAWRWGLLGSLLAAVAFAKIVQERSRPLVNWAAIALMATALFFGIVTDFNIRVHARDHQRTPFDPPEYVPVWADSSKERVIQFALAHEGDPLAQDTAGHHIPIHMLARQSNLMHFTIQVDTPMAVVLHHWYWPDWKAWDIRRNQEIAQRPFKDGRAVLELPAGKSDVLYELMTDESEKEGRSISVWSLAAVLVVTVVIGLSQRKKT